MPQNGVLGQSRAPAALPMGRRTESSDKKEGISASALADVPRSPCQESNLDNRLRRPVLGASTETRRERAPGRNRTGHWSCLRNRCSATEHPRAETVRCARWQDRSWKRGLGRALRTMIWHRVFNEQGALLGAHRLASRSFPNSENPRRRSMGIERVLAAGSGWRSRTSVAGTKAQCPASRRPRNGS